MKDKLPHRKTCKRYNTPWEAHELTFSCFCRRAFLSKDRTRLYLAEALAAARVKYRFDLWAYAFMPEHVHLLIWPKDEVYSISPILKAIKQSVGRRATNYLRRYAPQGLRWLATGDPREPYHFWLDGGGYDRNVKTSNMLRKSFTYIHNTPVKRGLVEKPEDWYWSSARDWADQGTGPIAVDKESCLNSLW